MSFVLSKILWTLLAPSNLVPLLLLILSLLALSRKDRLRRFAVKTSLVLSGFLVLLMFLPLGMWALVPLETAYPQQLPPKVDGIILLGGDENPSFSEKWGHPLMGSSSARHIRFAALAKNYPDAKLVFTGGIGWLAHGSKNSNGGIVRETQTSLGMSMDRLTVEDRSRNTFENAVFSKEIVQPKPDENWLLVTSAFHMPRSMSCFRQAGWNVFPAPTDYKTLGEISLDSHMDILEQFGMLTLAMHEYIGLAAYRLMGRTDALWP